MMTFACGTHLFTYPPHACKRKPLRHLTCYKAYHSWHHTWQKSEQHTACSKRIPQVCHLLSLSEPLGTHTKHGLSFCRQPAQAEYVLVPHAMVPYLEYGIQMTTCRVMTQMTMITPPTFNCADVELLLFKSLPNCYLKPVLIDVKRQRNRSER